MPKHIRKTTPQWQKYFSKQGVNYKVFSLDHSEHTKITRYIFLKCCVTSRFK